MTSLHRTPFQPSATHGNGRRPSRADFAPLDVAAIEAWNAANRRAREMYRRMPLAKGVVAVPR